MVTSDGTDTFQGSVVAGTPLDTVVIWKGTSLPVLSANKVPQNGFFLLLDSLTAPTTSTLYIQISATISVPDFQDTMVHEVGQSGDQLYPLDTTIGNYAIPSAVVGSSEKVLFTTEAAFAFTTTDTTTAVAITGQPSRRGMKLNTGHSGIGKVIQDIGIMNQRSGTPTGNFFLKVYNDAGVEQATSLAQDMATLSTSLAFRSYELTSSHTIVAGDRIVLEADGGDATNFVAIGTNNNASEGNPTPTDTESTSFTGSFTESSTLTHLMDFDFSPGAVTSDVENAIDDDVTTTAITTVENNPNQYFDTGSLQELASIAIHFDKSETTATEIEIRYSIDATFTSVEVVRILLLSDFTTDTWRFISIPRQDEDRQFFQIYATENSVALGINEVKYLTVTDWDRKHYHRFLDPALTSANSEDSD